MNKYSHGKNPRCGYFNFEISLFGACVGFFQLLLECPDDIFAFEFCPSDPNIIVGGCVNGQVRSLTLTLVFQICSLTHHETRIINMCLYQKQALLMFFVLSQIVLWDISAHVTHLQWTQSGGKKVSVDNETFVSIRVLFSTCRIS